PPIVSGPPPPDRGWPRQRGHLRPNYIAVVRSEYSPRCSLLRHAPRVPRRQTDFLIATPQLSGDPNKGRCVERHRWHDDQQARDRGIEHGQRHAECEGKRKERKRAKYLTL